MEKRVVNILTSSNKALTVEELDHLLENKSVEDLRLLQATLERLVKTYVVYKTNKDKYMLLSKSHYKIGSLRVNQRGFGFVVFDNDEEDLFIPIDSMGNALHNDTVLVEDVTKRGAEKNEGKVIKVIKRELQTLVGEIYFKKGVGYIIPDDSKVKIKLEIPRKHHNGAVNGHKVLVEIIKHINKDRYYGKVIKILGHKNDPGVDILSIIYKHDINTVFSPEVMSHLDKIPESVSLEEMQGRVDLRELDIFTIDGDDTKDIDDALSLEVLENGNFKLGVHIADVTYYVKENDPIDKEAMDRGTSVYLVDRVVPMLPHKLSNGICSLNPGVDRLAISCFMEIDKSGKLINYDIFESVIKSKIQMTYNKVNDLLDNDVVDEDYVNYENILRNMNELSKILSDMKDDRGYLDFRVDEAKILVDDLGVPTDITLRTSGTGEKMIENFMVAANETVATHIFYMELPFVYRVHEYPEEEKIRNFLGFLSQLGYTYTGNMKDTNPKSIQKLLEFIHTKEESKILSKLVLRNMRKAVYKPINLGHYGLASSCYTHFTSPIRRYPDTTVHRLLRTYLFENKMDKRVIDHWNEKLIYITEHSSQKERASIDCEREVESMKMAEYMQKHIGEEFEGMISSVMSFGMFVELDNLVEGLIRVADLDDFYIYDETRLTLTGERSKKRYTIGDKVLIKVKDASKEEKTIDFELIKKI